MKKIALLILVTPLVLFSCQETLDELSTIGTFKSTFTGDVAQQFDGEAAFVHAITEQATPQGSSLIVALSKVSSQDEAIGLSLTNDTVDGITTGTYELNSSGSGTVFIPVYTNDQETYGLPDPLKTNKVTISSVENLRVKGSFEVNLIEITSQKSTKIVGTFDAVGTTENK